MSILLSRYSLRLHKERLLKIPCRLYIELITYSKHTQLTDGGQDIYIGDGDNLEPDDVDMYSRHQQDNESDVCNI